LLSKKDNKEAKKFRIVYDKPFTVKYTIEVANI